MIIVLPVLSGSAYLPAGQSNNNNFFVSPGQSTQMVKTLRYEVDRKLYFHTRYSIIERKEFL